MISVQQLNKRFGRLSVLKEVSLEFGTGRCYALIGPNGSGKTTLIKCILGMVMPDAGRILVNGQSIDRDWGYRRLIGYMPQIGRYPDQMRIGQLFDMIRDVRQGELVQDDDLIREFRLDAMKDKRLHTLSGGTRQKVSAALAFLFNPRILILDEPTAGLDPLASEALKAKIRADKNSNRLLLITSHIMSDLDELCSHVTYLEDGTVRYDNSLFALKEVTGENKLGKAMAAIMSADQKKTEIV
ncbi:MAG TPA: ABC transporter ATP-binding protein [Cyclobacteriaceae bacterium]|nr:ABC transporter ATP-binding protein [Cyclobacteriaceae bacterium]